MIQSIDIVRDMEGIRLATIEVLEESFERDRIERTAMQATAESRARLLASISRPTMAKGYQTWCDHLWSLEAQSKVGLSLDGLTAYEMNGLVALAAGRREWEHRHPDCSRCKTRQSNRFGAQCEACKAKFGGKK